MSQPRASKISSVLGRFTKRPCKRTCSIGRGGKEESRYGALCTHRDRLLDGRFLLARGGFGGMIPLEAATGLRPGVYCGLLCRNRRLYAYSGDVNPMSVPETPDQHLAFFDNHTHDAEPEGLDVAILKTDIPVREGTASSPEFLREQLCGRGFEVTLIGPDEMADAQRFNTELFDVVILPYGPSFPAAAKDNLLRYLEAGGNFVSMGGYVASDLYAQRDGEWVDARELAHREEFVEDPEFSRDAGAVRRRFKCAFGRKGFLIDKKEFVSGGQSVSIRATDRNNDKKTAAFVVKLPHPAPGFLEVTARVKGTRVLGGWASLSAEWLDAKGGKHEEKAGPSLWQVKDGGAWEDVSKIVPVPKGARGLRCVLGVFRGAGQAWLDRLSVVAADAFFMNSRRLIIPDIDREQISAFDSGYELKHVVEARTSPDQPITSADVKLDARLEGFAAVGAFGNSNPVHTVDGVRLVPLLDGFDARGEPRGPIGSLAIHYGTRFKGSMWAYFGVTNRDLFNDEHPEMIGLLADVLRNMAAGLAITRVDTGLACYRQGEGVDVATTVFNTAAAPRDIRVRHEIRTSRGKVKFKAQSDATVMPGESAVVSCAWSPTKFSDSLYRVVATIEFNGRTVDEYDSGFCVWDEKAIRAGVPFEYRDNYFHFGGRPTYVHAVKTAGYYFHNLPYENPWRWDSQFRRMRDLGVDQFEPIHVVAFLGGGKEERLENPDEKVLRKVDALAILGQKHRVCFKLGMVDWVNAADHDEDALRAQASWARLLGERYRDFPCFAWDLEGDIPFDIKPTETTRQLWNEFLSTRHGCDEALREAWGSRASDKKLGELPAPDPGDFYYTHRDWDDASEHDLWLFKNFLFTRWAANSVGAFKEKDPHHPIGAEFWAFTDVPAGAKAFDFATQYQYGAIENLPWWSKIYDMRVLGKSLGINEFGVVHGPRWQGYWNAEDNDGAVDYFNITDTFLYALHGSVNMIWVWKDAEANGCNFGACYPHTNLPKDWMRVYRNRSFLFRLLAPKDSTPEVYYVLPDSHRFGSDYFRKYIMLGRGVDALLRQNVEFGIIAESDLERLPEAARFLVYPMPFCPSDEAYRRIVRFVVRGGTLYFSGDISYDPSRRRNREERLNELAGVRCVDVNYPNIELDSVKSVRIKSTARQFKLRSYKGRPCLKIVPTNAVVLAWAMKDEGEAAFTANVVGRGRVLYTPDLVELLPSADIDNVYSAVTGFLGMRNIDLKPHTNDLYVAQVDTAAGGRVTVAFNRNTDTGYEARKLKSGRRRFTFDIGPKMTAILAVDARNRPVAVEATGNASFGGRQLLSGDCHATAAVIEGMNLFSARAMLVTPYTTGLMRIRWPHDAVHCEAGRIEDRKWHPTPLAATLEDGFAVLNVEPVDRLGLVLLALPSHLDKARRKIETLATNPEKLR